MGLFFYLHSLKAVVDVSRRPLLVILAPLLVNSINYHLYQLPWAA